jgi:uncharacterized membrane protein
MQPTLIMDSKAKIAGHPIHPMVVVFPIALYTSTVVALIVYLVSADSFYYRAAMVANIGGVVMALVAAIPGAIDLFSLPRTSRARATAVQHASFAVLTTALFATSAVFLYQGWYGRVMVDGRWDLDATVPLTIGVVGMAAMIVVGVLGWTLVRTHHIGIDLAQAGAPDEPELDDIDTQPTHRPDLGDRDRPRTDYMFRH